MPGVRSQSVRLAGGATSWPRKPLEKRTSSAAPGLRPAPRRANLSFSLSLSLSIFSLSVSVSLYVFLSLSLSLSLFFCSLSLSLSLYVCLLSPILLVGPVIFTCMSKSSHAPCICFCQGITETCHVMYATKSGLAPEIVVFPNQEFGCVITVRQSGLQAPKSVSNDISGARSCCMSMRQYQTVFQTRSVSLHVGLMQLVGLRYLSR